MSCDKIKADFLAVQPILQALGQETRQHIVWIMMNEPECQGMRIMDIARKANLSKTSASYHVQVLVKAGVLVQTKRGTKNYYSFDPKGRTFEMLSNIVNEVLDAFHNAQ